MKVSRVIRKGSIHKYRVSELKYDEIVRKAMMAVILLFMFAFLMIERLFSVILLALTFYATFQLDVFIVRRDVKRAFVHFILVLVFTPGVLSMFYFHF